MFNKIVTYHDGVTYNTDSEREQTINAITNWMRMAKRRNIFVEAQDSPERIFYVDYYGTKMDIIRWYLRDYCKTVSCESFKIKLKTIFKIIKKKS